MTTPEQTHEWYIENADPSDAFEIAKMQVQSMRDTYLCKGNDARNALWKAYTNAYLNDERVELREQLILRALDNTVKEVYLSAKTSTEEIVGMLYGYQTAERQELAVLYTDSNYRQRGLGKALIEEFIKWSDPARPIELGVISDNENAKGFYKHMGFEEVPNSEHDFAGIEGETEITMVRKGDEQ